MDPSSSSTPALLKYRFLSREIFCSCTNSCTGHFFVMDWPMTVLVLIIKAGVIIMVRLLDDEWINKQ